MVCAVTGAWAGTIANNNGTITLDGLAAGDLDKALTDPTVWTSGNADDLNSATKVIFGSNVTLNDADLRALKTLVPAATQLNMAQVSLNEDANISNLETQAVEYLRLPNSMTSAEDVTLMKGLKSKNTNLKMVGAYNPNKSYGADVAIHSFEANNVPIFLAEMNIPTSGNPNPVPRKIRLSGEFGENDLVNGSTPNFGFGTSAEWDFTGAHFADCTIPQVQVDNYYKLEVVDGVTVDDPFCEGSMTQPSTVNSNAFYYFSQYRKGVVSIKLPDNDMTHLPTYCLEEVGQQNKSGYMALYGISDSEFNELYGTATTVTKYFDEDNNEYTGQRYEVDGQWKGRKTETCETDLTDVTPEKEQVYRNTWAGGKEYPVEGLEIIDDKVTPESFDILLDVSWYDGGGNQLYYPVPTNKDENGYYYYENNNPNGNKIYPNYTPVFKYNNEVYTGEVIASDNKFYGIYDNSEGNVSFDVSTKEYTYSFTDCYNVVQTVVSETELTSYTASREVEINLTPRDVDVYGEANCAPIETLVIPDCYTDLDPECALRAHIRHLVIGSGVKRIHGGAFRNSVELEDLDFGAGLSDCYIGDRAFNECRSMKHIALSEGVVSLGNGAFTNSQHLESIRLPQTLINIGNAAFKNCLALNSITIPQNVEKIGREAFALCPFTDIFLTTTDPAKIPIVYTVGNDFQNWDSQSSFNTGHYMGWYTMPDGPQQKALLETMSWDEAVTWYFIHCNGVPVLHFPAELADKVRSDISSTYHAKSTDQVGLPMMADFHSRETAGGADVGTSGSGIYTRDGWAQFMLMKEYTTDPGGDVYTKEYDDVWYTMCFPFDLTDEQLAAAFNETFNIVDFSGVEVDKANQTLILHFNNVAMTDYKDTAGKHYKRKMEGGQVVREQHGSFKYNVYWDAENNEYHHVNVSTFLNTNKTKTFAKGGSLAEAQQNYNNGVSEALMIDGILATAGHPYMIHPAIGVNDGGTTKKRCDFVGITWLQPSEWESAFTNNSRTIDLGIEKTLELLPDSNYNQAAYTEYVGQKYTFIGNPKEFVDEAQSAIGNEPQIPEEPVEPVAPPMPTVTLDEPSETITEPTALTNDEQEIVYLLTEGLNENERGAWYGITEVITATYNNGSTQANLYNQKLYIISNKLQQLNYNIYNGDGEAAFNYCKTTFNKSINYANAYAAYLANKALWDAYRANQAAWQAYNNYNPETALAEYQRLKAAYDNAVIAHNRWLESVKAYKVQIPKDAYFLGRKSDQKYPKYYRERLDESYGGSRTSGLWPQFTAIIKPNLAAVNGIEKNIDSGVALSKGFEMKFNEDFEGDFINPDDIQTIIEDARKEGVEPKVEYMDIVVNINGQIVRSGSTSMEGLPKGVYIVNGKKYFVK